MNSQMEAGWDEGRHLEIPYTSQLGHPPGTCMGSAVWKLSEPSSYRFLWKLQSMNMITLLMNNQFNFQPVYSPEAASAAPILKLLRPPP